MARVDDTLVQLHDLRQEVRNRLTSQSIEDMLIEEVRDFAGEIQEMGPLAIQSLFDLLFDPDPEFRRLIVIVLSEIDDPLVVEKIHRLLARPNLPEEVRLSLLAVEALHTDTSDPEAAEAMLPDVPFDSLLDVAEGFWENMELEEVSMMWCDNFAREEREHRMSMLEALMATSHPKLLGIARIELGLGDLKIVQYLAEKLGDFDDPFATRMLNSLLSHNDLVVRTLAERSLMAQKERGAKPPATGQKDRFHLASMATDDSAGQFSVLYALRSPEGWIRFVVLLLDRWDRGVVDCWGNVRFDRAQLKDLLATMNDDFGGITHRRVTKGTALTLIHEAMDLNERRNHPIPVEMYAWIHLIENERYKHDPNVPQFGVDCSLCHKPLKTSSTSMPWTIEDIAVCPRCTKKKILCPKCKGSMKLTQCLISPEKNRRRNELRCPHCYRSIDFAQL